MKYIRKIAVLLIAVIFLAALIIGLGVIFSVRNVNVSVESYSFGEWDEMDDDGKQSASEEIEHFREKVLNDYRGTLLGFVDEKSLAESFADTKYILESFEKVYPCTLDIVVKERREVFSMKTTGGLYNTYDSFGTLMREAITEDEAFNNIDRAPNVLVKIDNADDIVLIAQLASVFADKFSSLRPVVEAMEIHSETDDLIFRFRCGLDLRISGYENLTQMKMSAAYEKFSSLKDEDKLSGTIVVTVDRNGEIVAERFPDNGFIS